MDECIRRSQMNDTTAKMMPVDIMATALLYWITSLVCCFIDYSFLAAINAASFID